MPRKKVSSGVVHSVPEDLRSILVEDGAALERWEDITPLARNEWICWVEDAVKAETRQRRLSRLQEDLKDGKRRPCCWPGCPHREKSGKAS
ncbi:YdeI/OmpD-associated family protein [Dokdonella sp.]|uniref:YdeI/OmpD-associated family protein n=1 Tax=Dokdonella sp. TaxID=2291710 RepID=UPI0039C89D10